MIYCITYLPYRAKCSNCVTYLSYRDECSSTSVSHSLKSIDRHKKLYSSSQLSTYLFIHINLLPKGVGSMVLQNVGFRPTCLPACVCLSLCVGWVGKSSVLRQNVQFKRKMRWISCKELSSPYTHRLSGQDLCFVFERSWLEHRPEGMFQEHAFRGRPQLLQRNVVMAKYGPQSLPSTAF